MQHKESLGEPVALSGSLVAEGSRTTVGTLLQGSKIFSKNKHNKILLMRISDVQKSGRRKRTGDTELVVPFVSKLSQISADITLQNFKSIADLLLKEVFHTILFIASASTTTNHHHYHDCDHDHCQHHHHPLHHHVRTIISTHHHPSSSHHDHPIMTITTTIAITTNTITTQAKLHHHHQFFSCV